MKAKIGQMLAYAEFRNTIGKHNKDYKIMLLKVKDAFVVVGKWGAIGAKHSRQVKFNGTDINVAKKEFGTAVHNRYLHGYTMVAQLTRNAISVGGVYGA